MDIIDILKSTTVTVYCTFNYYNICLIYVYKYLYQTTHMNVMNLRYALKKKLCGLTCRTFQ